MRRRALWQQWSFGDPGERVAFRRRLLDVNAFYWLAGRARLLAHFSPEAFGRRLEEVLYETVEAVA